MILTQSCQKLLELEFDRITIQIAKTLSLNKIITVLKYLTLTV